MNLIYLDNAATTRIKSEVLNEMMPYLSKEYGNPSSLYSVGRNAKKAIEKARTQVAKLINCDSNEVYFTSCGSESDNTALKGYAYKNRNKGNHIITSKIEHPAILESCKNLEEKGFEISYINVDENGRIDLTELENAIKPNTILISIMFANNEIGTIQPMEEIARIAQEYGIVFHTDAVQAVGNVKIDVKNMNIDMLSMSGHKINAPKGIGVLYVKDGIEFERYIDGGHQERSKRSGTENVASIVGMGKACEIVDRDLEKHIINTRKLRDYYLKKLEAEIPNKYIINGSMEYRLPGNANIALKGVEVSKIIFGLDEKNICVSSGSACSSGNSEPSHVLTAINVPNEYIQCAIRTTFSDNNTFDEIDYVVKCLKNLI